MTRQSYVNDVTVTVKMLSLYIYSLFCLVCLCKFNSDLNLITY